MRKCWRSCFRLKASLRSFSMLSKFLTSSAMSPPLHLRRCLVPPLRPSWKPDRFEKHLLEIRMEANSDVLDLPRDPFDPTPFGLREENPTRSHQRCISDIENPALGQRWNKADSARITEIEIVAEAAS